jgi:small subunit ribosomal protein S21
MTTIRLKENEPVEVALRRFRREIERKRKKAAAVSRTRKRLRSQMLPKKLY